MTKNNIEFSKEAAISYLKLCGCKLDNPEELKSSSSNGWSMGSYKERKNDDGTTDVSEYHTSVEYNHDENKVTVWEKKSGSNLRPEYGDMSQKVESYTERTSVFELVEYGLIRILRREDTTINGYYNGDSSLLCGGYRDDRVSDPYIETTQYFVSNDFNLSDGLSEDIKPFVKQR